MASFATVGMSESPIRMGQYTVVKQRRLAEGGFGFVDLVVDSNMGKEFCLKRCSVQRPEDFEIVNKEVKMLNRFKTPRVVQLLEYQVTEKANSREALLLLEFCSCGHLLDALIARDGQFFLIGDIYRMFGQVLLAVQDLHSARPTYVVHRDLKLENLLVRADGTIVLCDFGSCVEGVVYTRDMSERSAADDVIQRQTTQMYRAPEFVDLYMREELTEKSDIWALGCIFYTLCFLEHPFQNQGSLAILQDRIKIPPSHELGAAGEALLRSFLDQDPEARPTVEQAFAVIKALSQGVDPPEIPLTEVAVERKDERRQRALRRANKKKAVVSVVAPRDVVVQQADSVAARRLRATSGASPTNVSPTNYAPAPSPAPVPQGQSLSPSQSQSQRRPSQSAEKLFDFSADFSSVSSPQRTSIGGGASAFDAASSDGFDPFDSTPAPASTSAVGSGGFDTFDSASAPASTSAVGSGGFDAFDSASAPSSTSAVGSGGFDAFDSAPSSTSAVGSGGFDAFDSASSSTSAVGSGGFDAFDSTSAPTPTPAAGRTPARSSFGAEFAEFSSPAGTKAVDTSAFSGFDNFDAPAQAQAPQEESRNSFDSFASADPFADPTGNCSPVPMAASPKRRHSAVPPLPVPFSLLQPQSTSVAAPAEDMLFDAFSPAEKHQPEPLAVMFPEAQENLPVASLVGASNSSNNAGILAAVATASLFGAVDNLVPQQEPTPAARRASGGGGGGGRNSFTELESVAPSSSCAMMGVSMGAMNSPGSMFGMGGSPMRSGTGAEGMGAMNNMMGAMSMGGGGGMGMGGAASPMLLQMSPPPVMGGGGGYSGGGGVNMQGMGGVGGGSRGSMSTNSPARVLTSDSAAPVRQTGSDPFGDLHAFR